MDVIGREGALWKDALIEKYGFGVTRWGCGVAETYIKVVEKYC